MMTVRRLGNPQFDAMLAVEPSLDPKVIVPQDDRLPTLANTLWAGSPDALAPLGLHRGDEVLMSDLRAAIAGQHARSAEKAREGESAFDLAFLAPTSVSAVWAQASPQLRLDIEKAVIAAAHTGVSYVVQSQPLISGSTTPGGFAAAMALHAIGHAKPWTEIPMPNLHVHCYLVGILGSAGRLMAADPDAMTEELTRLGGAVGRARLADDLRKLGFGIEAGTGPQRRSFEIAGVPEGLLQDLRSAAGGCAGLGHSALRR
jgi:hypothetical protein